MVGLYREKGWKRQIREETQQKKCDSYGQLKQHEITATVNISFCVGWSIEFTITSLLQTQSPVYYSHKHNHQSITVTITSLLQSQTPVYYNHNHQSITVTDTITSLLQSPTHSPVYYSHKHNHQSITVTNTSLL